MTFDKSLGFLHMITSSSDMFLVFVARDPRIQISSYGYSPASRDIIDHVH